MICEYCNPKHSVIYGSCKVCGRECQPTLVEFPIDRVKQLERLGRDFQKSEELYNEMKK